MGSSALFGASPRRLNPAPAYLKHPTVRVGLVLIARAPCPVSACRGAGARTYSGKGLVGFAWALLHAGARNVIAGLWDVNDLSTAELMETTYSQLAAGAGPAVAKLRLIRSAGNFRKPYYWGPFQHWVAPW